MLQMFHRHPLFSPLLNEQGHIHWTVYYSLASWGDIWKIFFQTGLAFDDAGGPHEDDDNDDDGGCRPENGDNDKDNIDEDDNHEEEDDDDNNEEDEDDDGGCHGPAQQLTLPPVIESWKVSCLCISRRTVCNRDTLQCTSDIVLAIFCTSNI